MELHQQLTLPQSVGSVWAALNDPKMLQQCLPGCERFEAVGPDQFEMTVSTKIGPVKAKFTGAIVLSELNPPLSYVIKGEGKGGVAGFAKGSARVSLGAMTGQDGDATRLTYSVDASVGGKIAQLGGRLIQGAARKMAQDFFTKFVQILCDDETLVPEIETVSAS